MELYIIILTLTIVLSTDPEVKHEAFQFTLCSDTEGGFYLGYDEEEVWHVNFDQKTEVLTLPDFTGPLTFDGFYERGLERLAKCQKNLLGYITGFKSPPPEIDAPHTSIYPKDDVQLGVQNTLICHVTDFYPPSVSISWTKNNVNVTEGIRLSQYHPKTDGTFNIFSTMKFTPAEGDIYSCTVNHIALQGQPQTKIWDFEVALPSVGPAVLCGVGLTVGLLGVTAGTFFFIKGNKCN
ncbi:H-2 class II histocompatibility antigen, A-Q alpha chain-like [Ctenopharyngodon idella]|uniref:H-2 class II histocompatibility antigen, A-Q alpha chain-like n=1 Tax=Ctenopharyngodon idella TaxID=7959 RepID=UPI002230191D|nr:H-2 class II histocompatibility antigen, A-Q alpha chain-like [Ctenopharyngodon idella]